MKLKTIFESKIGIDTVTIEITVTPEDENNFNTLTKDFKKIKFTNPKHTNNQRKLIATATGKKRDLLNFLSSDDGAGYGLDYIKKTWPEVLTNKV